MDKYLVDFLLNKTKFHERIPLIIPSKDRASQLDALLRSIDKYVPQLFFPIVILKTTNNQYNQAYELLMSRRKDFMLYNHQTDFQKDLESLLEYFNGGEVGFLTDDCVFYRPITQTVDDVKQVLLYPNILCVSLRLGLNTTLQYYATGQMQQPLNNPLPIGKFISWNWKQKPKGSNYGYPFSWDGHIYRAVDLLRLSKTFEYKNPREFEASIDHRHHMISQEWMASLEKGSLVVNTVNQTQDNLVPAGLYHHYSLKELNDRYLAGEVIDNDALEIGDFTGCHGEWPLSFKKHDG